MRILAYLRASTSGQDASRARQELRTFATSKNLDIHRYFIENASGATRERPMLKDMLLYLQKSDIILIESIDRLSRLKEDDFNILINQIKTRGAKIVIVDNPLTHVFLEKSAINDPQLQWFFNAQSELIISISAALSRSDYELRRKRTLQGIEKAKLEGRFKGRPDDIVLQNKIAVLLKKGLSYRDIENMIGASSRTIAKVKKDIKIYPRPLPLG